MLVLAGCGGDSDGVGSPAARSEGRRVVEIHQLPSKRFSPDTITVQPGETVTFRVVNDDTTFHEFMVADSETHAKRDKEMAEMGSEPMAMEDERNVITLRGGQTEELTWRFPQKGTVTFACHQPGHYAAGMRGTVTIS
jgi:uncharacterized cupredoxin-like copper-binding protein